MAWRDTHREQERATAAEYRTRNREAILESQRDYHNRNREAIAKKNAERRVNNIEAYRERAATYVKENWISWAIKSALGRAKERCCKNGVPFNVSKDYVLQLILNNNNACAVCGIPFQKSGKTGHKGPFSPSIDRIKPELGYVEGNVRVVLDGINCLKGSGTDEDMWKIIDAMVEKRR